MGKPIEINKPSDMPKGVSWLIIEFDSQTVYHEGDERSRTNPGHGYPAYSESFMTHKITAFDNEQEWRTVCEGMALLRKGKFIAMQSQIAEISLKPVIELK